MPAAKVVLTRAEQVAVKVWIRHNLRVLRHL
jgi:hypothetical protein